MMLTSRKSCSALLVGGYTLVELLIAMALLSSSLLGTFALKASLQHYQQHLVRHEQALRLAERQLGILQQTPFASLAAQPMPTHVSQQLPGGEWQEYQLSWLLVYQDAARKDIQLTVQWGAEKLVMTTSLSAIFLPSAAT